jgi:hypothetical protein
MIVKLPLLKKTWKEDTQTVERVRIEKSVQIDTSFKAHLKWEEQFGATLGCDLITYTERVEGWIKNPESAKAQFLGLLKLLYCYINADWLPTFSEFASLFDYEIADELIEKIRVVLSETNKTIGKN